MNAALLFEPDAYVTDGRQMMGRRAAGAAFLRAAVEGRGDGPLTGYGASPRSAEQFVAAVRAIDPAAPAHWVRPTQPDLLARIGALHWPDLALAPPARLRLRHGAAAYSITGITHTLSSHDAMRAIDAVLTEPLMPWDAIICSSTAAASVLRAGIEEGLDYLRWRVGATQRPPLPQLPVIPLGVHSRHFAPSPDRRAAARAARAALGIAEDEVALIFAGRLSVSSKAHPFQMYDALQRLAAGGSRRIVLIHAGQFFNKAGEDGFRAAAARFCPDVRALFVDGADQGAYNGAFAAADIFLSLADSVQETFGITPIEAMAAGLPVVVSDWDGYRDTVRDGIDGFRIACWSPGPASGAIASMAYEAGHNYDLLMSRTSSPVAIDDPMLGDRLATLIDDADLRRRMGAAALERARGEYDWAVVYRRYQALWAELAAIRATAGGDPAMRALLDRAPGHHPAQASIWARFAGYATHAIGADTAIAIRPDATADAYRQMIGDAIFTLWRIDDGVLDRVFALAASPGATVGQLAASLGAPLDATIEMAGRLAKMNLLRLGDGA